MTFVNREYELQRLRELSTTGKRNMVLLYGRRRIGKTYLLTHAWKDTEALYFTASATSPAINRRALLREASIWSGEDFLRYTVARMSHAAHLRPPEKPDRNIHISR